jgi:hypothetical protein
MDPERLTRSDLIALARKYRLLAELRRGTDPWPAELAVLTREFPGVLRELDLLALDEIDRRLEALERAVASGRVERWMLWMHAYHQSMRVALELRRRLAGSQRVATELASELAQQACRESGCICDAQLVISVITPGAPALHVVVLECLARATGTQVSTIRRALFPEASVFDAFWARI